jgi:hypothetical protein
VDTRDVALRIVEASRGHPPISKQRSYRGHPSIWDRTDSARSHREILDRGPGHQKPSKGSKQIVDTHDLVIASGGSHRNVVDPMLMGSALKKGDMSQWTNRFAVGLMRIVDTHRSGIATDSARSHREVLDRSSRSEPIEGICLVRIRFGGRTQGLRLALPAGKPPIGGRVLRRRHAVRSTRRTTSHRCPMSCAFSSSASALPIARQ